MFSSIRLSPALFLLSLFALATAANADTPINVPPLADEIKNYRELDASRSEQDWKEGFGDVTNTRVAISVSGDNMRAEGGEAVIRYKTTYTNTHPRAWIDGGSHFRVPVSGLYLFSLNFTNENSNGSSGDDLYMVIRKNGESKGFAFAGTVSRGNADSHSRKSGSYTVAMELEQNDVIHTAVAGDSPRTRFIRFFHLTGVLVQPAP